MGAQTIDPALFIPAFVPTPEEQIPQIVAAARTKYNTGITRSIAWRKEQLRGLYRCFDENEALFCEASHKDMRKNHAETWTFDVLILKNEIVDALENIDDWVKPERVNPGIVNILDTAEIRRDPQGVCLVIGAWNYPYQLTLGPLAAAIAGGNAVIIKPSEVASHAAMAMTHLLPKYIDSTLFPVINGGIPETTALLKLAHDHIFYTGNGAVAKIVMAAAAKHLTPVVLELGGKSPVIIDETVHLPTVAKRVMWAKSINCGQTCVAPDYVLIPKAKEAEFAAACEVAVKELYGDTRTAPEYPRLITLRQFDRVKGVLEAQKALPNTKISVGGETDADDLYIQPTVVTGVKGEDPIMQDEIFGPLLPVVTVESIDDAISFIQTRDKPLALYVFSNDKRVVKKVLERTDSGNAIINDLMMNMTMSVLPFGGVGPSGQGKYHGHHGFLTYTHARGTLYCPSGMNALTEPRYPKMAYTKNGRRILQFVMEHRMKGPIATIVQKVCKKSAPFVIYVLCAVLGLLIGAATQNRWSWWVKA
ncbi:hypothetical protein PhCBS80983_g03917 [Powellomyces hirtus]|uniref:Aldehyde dehydrogenase n=1 Tax=Powellomyces hirtus TaxID=109895 RepID=A0A507E207_9FUNG|nr:hypothetical protein PhCBS80983_g03917 [Powellomyces hirtus]